MSREESVWAEVLNILKTDADLSYFKNVYEGWRDNVPENFFPCIYLEPDSAVEEPYAVPMRHRVTFAMHIIAELNVSNSYDKQIKGDEEVKGIIDIANDIKSALWKYPNLNTKCQKFSFPNTRYSFANFPFRQVDITMNIEIITTGAAR